MAEDLHREALAAQELAYAPYSRFPVGAAIRTASGAIFTGCNVENASSPEGWCAETSAIAAMISSGERAIAEICVVAESTAPISPCGGCRQRLAEFGGPEMVIFSADASGVRAQWTLADLLPAAFDMET